MASFRVGVSARDSAGQAAGRISGFAARLEGAAGDFAREGTDLLRSSVVDLVAARTGMSGAVAERITKSRMEGPNRGLVFFEQKRPYEIRPRKKKALAWPGGRHPVKVVRHPGSRPWKLIGRAADSGALGTRLEILLHEKAAEALR